MNMNINFLYETQKMGSAMKMNIDNISFKVDTQIINFIKVVENKKMIRI